jgi:hypothetical protein
MNVSLLIDRPLRLHPVAVLAGLFVLSRGVMLAGMTVGEHGNLLEALRAAGNSWDSHWYEIVVTSWYSRHGLQGGFYPGYPLLTALFYEPLKTIAHWLDPAYLPSPPLTPASPMGRDPLLVASLLLAANLSLVVALVALWKLYRPELGAGVTLLGCALLLTAPSALFLSTGYAESTFIAASALAFCFAQRGRWPLAGLAGAAACTTRLAGAFLVVAFLIIWLQGPRPRPLGPALLGAAVLLAGVAAFPTYTWAAFGDPLLYEHLQALNWGHRAVNPLDTYRTILRRLRWGLLAELRIRPSPEAAIGPRVQIVDGLMTIWATCCAALGWLRLPLAQVVWIAAMLALPLPTGGNGYAMNRYLLEAWPAFFLTAWWLRRHRWLAAAVMVAGLAAMFLFARDDVGGRTYVG